MGSPRFPDVRIVVGAVVALIVATACVTAPLATATPSGGSAAPSLGPTAADVVPSPSASASSTDVQTPAPSLSRLVSATVEGRLVAGPTCPVEAVPPNPACAPRPVAGATILAIDSAGATVARAVSSTDGSYHLNLEPGIYELAPQPIPGQSIRAPAAKRITIGSDASPLVVDFSYDTGIR